MAVKTKDIIIDIDNFNQDAAYKSGQGSAIYFRGKSIAELLTAIENGTIYLLTDGINLALNINGHNLIFLDYIKQNGSNSFKYIKTDEAGNTTKLTDIIEEELVILPNGMNVKQRGASYTGTVFGDIIDGSGYRIYAKNKITKVDELVTDVTKKGITAVGGKGRDSITGSMYSDTLKGGAGYDTILGGTGNDTIDGGEGDDTITGGEGDDKLTGGKGGDTFKFTSSDGADTITDADNTDKIEITGVNADDLRFGKNKNNLEIFFSDDYDDANKIVVQNYFSKKEIQRIDTIVINDNPPQSIATLINNNLAITGKGTINGTKDNDVIIGSGTKDTIKAVGGINTVKGNGGDDALYGGTTADSKTTFVFKAGDGNDTVNSGKGVDTLQFNDVDLSKVVFEQGKVKKDLVIKYSDNDSVTVKNYYTVDKQGNITGIDTKNSVKHFIVNGEEYSDGILLGTPEKDRIYTLGDTSVRKIYAGDGNDFIDADVDNLTIYGGNGNDNISVRTSGTTVYGGDGNDRINVFGENNIVYGGKGSDEFYDYYDGIAVTQTVYIFNNGDGNDRLNSWDSDSALQFSDTSLSDLKLERVGEDLVIKHNKGKDSVTITGYYQGDYYGGPYGSTLTLIDKTGREKSLDNFVADYHNVPESTVKKLNGTKDDDYFRLHFVENYTVNGNDGNDRFSIMATGTTINGGNGNDRIGISGTNNTVCGGKGNDVLHANENWVDPSAESNAVFVFNKGDGNDRLAAYGSDVTLKFADSLMSDLFLERAGEHLVIKYNKGKDSITLELYGDDEGAYTLVDKKGQVKSLVNFMAEYTSIPATATTDIIGTDNDDRISVDMDNVKVYGKKGDDTISVNASGTTVYGGDGSDDIYINSGENNTACGGKGNDYFGITGYSEEPSTLIFNKGDGHDIIADWYTYSGTNLRFNDVLLSDMTIENKDSGLVLWYNSGKDSISFPEYSGTSSYTIIDKDGNQTTLEELNQNINYIASQVAAFASTGNAEPVMMFDQNDTSSIPLVMS